MSTPIIITLLSLAILAFIIIGGIVSSKATTESSFFSIQQTNWLRSIAILMVMFSHFYTYVGLTYSDGIISFCLNFGYMGVAVFFLLSGYSMMISFKTKPDYLKGFIPKRLLRLYVPFSLAFVLDLLLLLITGQNITIKDFLLFPIMTLPGALNWYLKIQLCLYFVFYVLAKLIKNRNALISSMILLSVVYMIMGYTTGIEAHWYETVFAFPIGMIIAEHREKIYNQLNRKYILRLVLSLIVFVICLAPYYLKGGTVFEIVFIFGFLQLIVCICAKICGTISLKVFIWLGTISLELYLVHILLLNNIIQRIDYLNNKYINFVVFILFIVLSISLSEVIHKTSNIIISRFLNKKAKNTMR